MIATGETLAQVQDRVLGVGVNSSSLFTAVPGYATGGIRFGFKAGRHQLTVHAENLNDENYRGISWGVDAPGRGISARYSLAFCTGPRLYKVRHEPALSTWCLRPWAVVQRLSPPHLSFS